MWENLRNCQHSFSISLKRNAYWYLKDRCSMNWCHKYSNRKHTSSVINNNKQCFASVCTIDGDPVVKWLFKYCFSKKHIICGLYCSVPCKKCHMNGIIYYSFNPTCKNCSWMCEESLIFRLKWDILLEFQFKRILPQLLHWIPLATHNYRFWYL